jgi:E3 ubiquitin-protein ligase RNF14
MCIEEGDVSRVGCPDPECVKKGSEAGEEEVARVVTETELQRWKWLKEKRNIERGGYGSGLAFVEIG